MKNLKQFNISFVGLKEEKHLFNYQLDKTFFTTFDYEEFNEANINVDLEFDKKPTLLTLHFTASGSINVPCDVTNELFNQTIEANLKLIVKFGPEFNDDNEDVLILPYDEFQINVAQYIYEMIVLAVPQKRVHPQVLDGTMQSEVLEKLKQLEIKQEKPVEENTTDPRWDKLKDLLTDK